eukprot:2639-Chlamydomonas_euryale.AAC.2
MFCAAFGVKRMMEEADAGVEMKVRTVHCGSGRRCGALEGGRGRRRCGPSRGAGTDESADSSSWQRTRRFGGWGVGEQTQTQMWIVAFGIAPKIWCRVTSRGC